MKNIQTIYFSIAVVIREELKLCPYFSSDRKFYAVRFVIFIHINESR